MKRFSGVKKVLSVALALVIALSLTVTAFAANGVNAAEQRVLDRLGAGVKYGTAGYTYTFPKEAINATTNYFMQYEMTDAQADEIIADIDAAQARAMTEDVTRINDLSGSTKSYILGQATAAAAVVGLKLSYANGRVVITDANGNQVFSYSFVGGGGSGGGGGTSGGVIKPTGADINVMAPSVAVVSVLAVIAVGAVLIRKFNLIKE